MKKVKFVSLNEKDGEVWGRLLDDKGNPLTDSGWWRTTDKVEAAKRAILSAELNLNDCSLEIV